MAQRIKITSEDFKQLVQGNVITKDKVEIALEDISFELMIHHIRLATAVK